MATRQLKIGAQAPIYPPMHRALEATRRIEAQGWDYLNYPDQLPPPYPAGLLAEPNYPADDERAIISCISTVFFGSLEMQAAAATLTNGIGVHVAVIDALRRNPALFAQELVTISHLAKGRSVWAIGSGEAKQFEPYGAARDKPFSRMEEALRIMHALWDSGGEPVTRDSEFWPLKDALFPIPLYNGTKPRILLVGGGPRVVELAGELADGWLTFLPQGCEDNVDALAESITAVKRSAIRHGRDPEAMDFNAKIHLVLADDDETAWRIARSPAIAYSALAGSMTTVATWKKWGFEHPVFEAGWNWPQHAEELLKMDPAIFAELAEKVPDEVTDHSIVWGGPERVAARLARFVETGLTHISLNNFTPWSDPSQGSNFASNASKVLVALGHSPLDLGA